MTRKRSVFMFACCLCLSAISSLPTPAQTTQPSPSTDQPAYWLARAARSIPTITDPADPDYGLVTRADALSTLAQSAHELSDPQRYDQMIQATQECISKINDISMRDDANWSLAEALCVDERFDQAQQTVDAITDPAIRALALMTTAVAHARLDQLDNYHRISDAAEQALADAIANENINDPSDPMIDETGWMWFSLIEARLRADDVPGALALVDKRITNPADRAAALAAIGEKQTALGNKQAATATLDRALQALRQLQAMLNENPDTLVDIDTVYNALAPAHAALDQQDQTNQMLARIDLPDLKAEALSACAVYLDSHHHTTRARNALATARTLLDQPVHPLLINHWSWFEVSKNSTRVGDIQANAQWIDSLKDPTTRALAELGALRGLIERSNLNP